MTQMEVDDRCYEMALMICDKKDAGQEELGLRYLNELEKNRSVIVERVYKFEEKNIANESRRMVEQLGRRDQIFIFWRFFSKKSKNQNSKYLSLLLEKDRLELVEYLMNVYEKGDQSFGNKLLSHVEDNKYDWVMKICKENLYGTAEGSIVRELKSILKIEDIFKINYDLTKELVFATDTFRDQVIFHLTAQLTKGNNKASESLINEMKKQQDM